MFKKLLNYQQIGKKLRTQYSVQTIFNDSSELITELGGRSLTEEIILQPYIETKSKTDSIIRVFYEPPKFRFFSVIEGMQQEDACATKIRESNFTEVLEQCLHLFSMITKKFFHFSNLKVDGMIFDFVQHKTGISLFKNISGFHLRNIGPASASSTKTSGFGMKKMSNYCAGSICKEKNSFITRLIQAIKQVMKVPNPPSLLYNNIATYQNDFQYYSKFHDVTEFGIGYPYVGEKITHHHVIKKQGENSSGPTLFDVVPVCEDCFYIYSLYRGKKEKLRTPKPMLEKIFDYLRRQRNWTDVEFEILVSACDPKQESYEMMKYKYVLPRSTLYASKPHLGLNENKPRKVYTGDDLAEKSQVVAIKEEYRKAQISHKADSKQMKKSFLPVIQEKKMKNTASLMNKPGEEGMNKVSAELLPKPKINKLEFVKDLYLKEISKIRRSIHSQSFE